MTTQQANTDNPHEKFAYEQVGEKWPMFCYIENRATMHQYEGQLVASDEPSKSFDLAPHRVRGLFTCMGECKSTTTLTNRTLVQDREIQEARKAA